MAIWWWKNCVGFGFEERTVYQPGLGTRDKAPVNTGNIHGCGCNSGLQPGAPRSAGALSSVGGQPGEGGMHELM